MLEIIHMTAMYSNAVLVAILPQVSDFAKKLELPLPQPITANLVTKFRPMPLKGYIGGGIQISNYLFTYSMGCVDSFRSSDNVFFDENALENWPKYAYGKDNMTTNDAMALARDSLNKLGYKPELLHIDKPPQSIQGPFDLNDGHHVPHCEIRWESIAEPKTAEESQANDIVTVQINMEKKTVTGISIVSKKIWREPPKVDVEPELEKDYKQRNKANLYIRTNAPPTFEKK